MCVMMQSVCSVSMVVSGRGVKLSACGSIQFVDCWY